MSGDGRRRPGAGVSINDLTDPERLDLSGNAALNGVPVSVSAGETSREAVDSDGARASGTHEPATTPSTST